MIARELARIPVGGHGTAVGPRVGRPEAGMVRPPSGDRGAAPDAPAVGRLRSPAALLAASGGRLARAGHALLQLQREQGNRYVQRVVDAAHAESATGPAGDRYERQADRLAQRVVDRRPERPAQTAGVHPVSGIAAGGSGPAARARQMIGQVRGGGQRLPGDVRDSMERAFGADFSRVRTHADARADQLSRSLGARAFTTGHDIVFRRDAYAPGSRRGRTLIAHELTHVLQQSAAGAGPAGGVVQCNRPEDYRSYDAARRANRYSREYLDEQRTDLLDRHIGKSFTPEERENVLDANERANGGVLRSDVDNRRLVRRDTSSEPQVDHRFPKSRGGTNSYANAAVIPANTNISKGQKLLLGREPTKALKPYRALAAAETEVVPFMDFSAEQRDKIYEANKDYYGLDAIISDQDGVTPLSRVNPTKLANVDHITPESGGGSSYYFNARVMAARANIQKGGKRRRSFFYRDEDEDSDVEDAYDYDELIMTLEEFIEQRYGGEAGAKKKRKTK
jgi:5-methylcytosine-specific restriction endonuclease McrA